MKVWVTKWALSTGVFTIEVGFIPLSGKIPCKSRNWTYTLSATEYAQTPEEAENQVAKLLTAKLRSLEKQKNKLLEIQANLINNQLPMEKDK